ncbi:MAG: class I SAM-dependent methyltransferase [Kiloniellales bacterium]|nr:class I SAM-dependent methyltransferase [Myxococcota bacterium]MDJ0980866.1 class I SAM-dependent methyltransferase [Kiloniellales bacterium]
MSEPGASDESCPICGSADPRVRYRLSEFRILDCRSCTQTYLRPLPSPENIQALFAELYTGGHTSLAELEGYYDFCYRDEPDNPLVRRYELWLDAVERQRPPGRLLDVGCGTGLFMAVAKRRGWEPFGVDASEEATEHARNELGLDVWIGEFSDFPPGQDGFDAITGWDIIEHARDPVGLLRTARRCLAPGGVVALSTPNQRSVLDVVAGNLYRLSGGLVKGPLEKFYIDQHFLYFTPGTLARSLERAGLEVVELERELTDLERLTLSPFMRTVLRVLFRLSRWTGRENRLFAVARASEPS